MNDDGKQQFSLFAAKTISSIVFIFIFYFLFFIFILSYRREGGGRLFGGTHWPTEQLPLSICPADITWTRVFFPFISFIIITLTK
jgi:hypothetical protein